MRSRIRKPIWSPGLQWVAPPRRPLGAPRCRTVGSSLTEERSYPVFDFETDRLDLMDPMQSGGAWLRTPGIKLPPNVLEKFHHGNAERLIPGLKPE